MATVKDMPAALPVSSQARPSSIGMADVYGAYPTGGTDTVSAGSSGASRQAATSFVPVGAPVDAVVPVLRSSAMILIVGLGVLAALSWFEGS